MTLRLLLLGCSVLALMAGCVGDSGGAAKLSYEGTDSGTHDDSAKCDKDATIVGTGDIKDGTLRVSVTDGDGVEKFSDTYDGNIDVSGDAMDGASGTWTITAVRTPDEILGDDFDGSYTFNLSC